MKMELPDIGPEERTPLVERLLDRIHQLLDRVRQLEETNQQLRDEVAVGKGQKPRPQIRPSRLETPPRQPDAKKRKRPGSKKRGKNAELTIHKEEKLHLDDPPVGSWVKCYEEYVVQELKIECRNTRYWRARYQLANGTTVLAPLPSDVIGGLHFGPCLVSYVLHQYYDAHVTQPLLLEQLQDFGIDISAGQLSRLLTENKESFHQEKAEVLATGLAVSSYIGTDDTGARHQGKNGYCTVIGNDLFAYFESTQSKSRLNFLEVLHGGERLYAVNEMAVAYWERQKLPAELVAKLCQGPQEFTTASVWQEHLTELEMTSKRHVRIATEGALLGGLVVRGVPADLGVLSDGALQFVVFVHAACWVHAERPLARLVPHNDQHRIEIEKVREDIWELYKDLKKYRQQPDDTQKAVLEKRFAALCEQRTSYPSINGPLKAMRDHKADLLRVLERPEIPLHNNAAESDIREYVKKRKISGSTRSDAGRRCRDTFTSLKKTCRKLGVKFWDYLTDRILDRGVIPRLSDLIRQRAKANQVPDVQPVSAS